MKKHENAIKMLMKNAIDTKTLYGWYEDDNGARLMTNGHLIIKLSGATLDYVGDFQKMNDKNNDKCFTDRMNDIIEVAKKGEYKTNVNIQDIKMFGRHNTDRKPFCVQYSDNGYIGFNPYYFSKLNILTGSDLITVIDSKSPFYMCGDDIECVLLPVMLDKTYNADNYALFLEELKACYIQDEADKAARKEKKEAKAAKAAGVVPTIEPLKEYSGYLFNLGVYDYFMLTDAKRKTDTIAKAFVNAVCDNKKIIQETRERALNDKATLNDFKKRIESATLTIKEGQNGVKWLNISGQGFNINNPLDEIEKHFYFIDCIVPTFTEEVKTPEKVEEVKPAEVATIEKDAEVKTEAPKAEATPTTAHKSNNCLFVTVAKDIKPDKIAQLQNVANLPTLASVPTYSAYLAHKINNIVNTKRNTNNGKKAHGRNAHKRTNGATLAECAGVLKVANTS